jgi:hypothetical protein
LRRAAACGKLPRVPRYLIERQLGDISDADLDEAADYSTQVRLEQFPGMEHEHTHVTRGEDGVIAFCVYRADAPETVRAHAEAANLPVARILEVERDLEPPAA